MAGARVPRPRHTREREGAVRVRMLTTVAEPGRVLEAGEEYELDAVEARDLCARPGDMPRAEPVGEAPAKRRQTRAGAAREEREV